MTGTYDGKYRDGSKSYGGYADYARVPSHFVIKIPDEMKPEEVAPMLCGGVTTYSPLKKNGAGPNTRVGIVGIGGLGHFGLLWAKVKLPFVFSDRIAFQRVMLTRPSAGFRMQGNHRYLTQFLQKGRCTENRCHKVYRY